MPRTFEHLQGRQRRPNVYDEVTSHIQWGETFRGRFPEPLSEGANYHFPKHHKPVTGTLPRRNGGSTTGKHSAIQAS